MNRRSQITAIVAFQLSVTLAPPLALAGDELRHFREADVLPWLTNGEVDVMRWKTLVGGIEGGQIPERDVQFGLMQLAPGAIYPGHRHPAPEIYYVIEGTATWTVGDETIEAGPGTTVHTPPGTTHRMVVTGSDGLTAVWVWWAPGGDATVFRGAYDYTEALPEQPGPGFTD